MAAGYKKYKEKVIDFKLKNEKQETKKKKSELNDFGI